MYFSGLFAVILVVYISWKDKGEDTARELWHDKPKMTANAFTGQYHVYEDELCEGSEEKHGIEMFRNVNL